MAEKEILSSRTTINAGPFPKEVYFISLQSVGGRTKSAVLKDLLLKEYQKEKPANV